MGRSSRVLNPIPAQKSTTLRSLVRWNRTVVPRRIASGTLRSTAGEKWSGCSCDIQM